MTRSTERTLGGNTTGLRVCSLSAPASSDWETRRYIVTLGTAHSKHSRDMSVDSLPTTELAKAQRARVWHRRLDWLGASASFMCALHCAALPILFALTPFVSTHWLASHAFDTWAVALALTFGAAVIGAAYCTHRWRATLALYLTAALLMIVGAFLVHEPAWLHASLLAIGGLLLAAAHLVNRRSALRHGCTRNLWTQLLGAD